MRRGTFLLVAGIAALVVGPSLAQQKPGFGMMGRGMNPLMLLPNNVQLQKELNVNEEQLEKLKDASKKFREDNMEEFGKLRNPDVTAEERQAIMKKMNDGNAKIAKEILKPEQVKRLKQIEYQMFGLAMFQNEEVLAALKLDDDQKEKIKSIGEDMAKDMREMFQGGGGNIQEAMKKIEGLRKESLSNAVKMLKPDQKKAYTEMVGAPFTLDMAGFKPFGGKPGGKPPQE